MFELQLNYYKALLSLRGVCTSIEEMGSLSDDIFKNLEMMNSDKTNKLIKDEEERVRKWVTPPLNSFSSAVSYSQALTDTSVGYGSELKDCRHFVSFSALKARSDLIALAKEQSVSNGSNYYQKFPYRIGVIADRFLWGSLKDVADVVYLEPSTWQEIAKDTDFLFVASTWRGLNDEWVGMSSKGSFQLKVLQEIVDYYQKADKRTVFFSKEDPVHYQQFLKIAKLFDYVLTTSAECVPMYKDSCKHSNVFPWLFGINPEYHNPIGSMRQNKQSSVFFSGTYYQKYPKRCKDMEFFFNGVAGSGRSLLIVDRNYENSLNRYCYPEKYWSFIIPSINHEDLQKIHKLHYWSLAFNTVQFSETMFANRCFELLALGSLLLSNYSLGLTNILPDAFVAYTESEASSILSAYSDEYLMQRQVSGIRNVMSNHNIFLRMSQLLDIVGLPGSVNSNYVAVVVDRITPKVLKMFESQSYRERRLFEVRDFSETEKQKHSAVSFWNESDSYGYYYLEDLMNGFKYTKCDYITKDCFYRKGELVAGVEHDYVSSMKSKYRTIFWAEAYSFAELIHMPNCTPLKDGYSIDRFNYSVQVSERANSLKKDYKISVILPIYNNGKLLFCKAFSSLLRSSIFEELEILLIDDGSTDLETVEIIKALESEYENVKAFYYDTGGSGSASRARNKGQEMATGECVTWLDPDNEAINDGYAKFYETLKKNDCDLVIGNTLRAGTTVALRARVNKIFPSTFGSETNNGTSESIVSSNFYAVNPQSALVTRHLLTSKKLQSVEGAVGQDTLYGWELMLAAKKIVTSPVAASIYYANVSGSVTNHVSTKYFRKLLMLQPRLRNVMDANNLLRDYMAIRYENYLKVWVFGRLSRVGLEDCIESTKLVKEYCDFYADVYCGEDPQIDDFLRFCDNNEWEQAFYVATSIDVAGK